MQILSHMDETLCSPVTFDSVAQGYFCYTMLKVTGDW